MHAKKKGHDGQPWRAKLTTLNRHPEPRTLDQLAAAFGCDLSTLKVRKSIAGDTKGAAPSVGGKGEIDELLVWLKSENLVTKDDGSEWVTIVACPWASEHTTGEATASYSPLGRGSDESGPDEDTPWAQTRGFKCFHGHCEARGYKEFSKWIVEQGGPRLPGTVDPRPTVEISVGNFARDVSKIRRILADVEPRQYFTRGDRPVLVSQNGSIEINGVKIPAGAPRIVPITKAVADIELTKRIRFVQLSGMASRLSGSRM
jgi:hypothetical protein